MAPITNESNLWLTNLQVEENNFSPVSRAEISARIPEQIFLKRRLRLHEESSSPVKEAEKLLIIYVPFSYPKNMLVLERSIALGELCLLG